MRSSKSQPRKTITTIFILSLILVSTLSVNAQIKPPATKYIDLCYGDSYLASVSYNSRATYQWQVSAKNYLAKVWGDWMNISKGATSYRYTFTAPSSTLTDYRIQCLVTYLGQTASGGITEFDIFNETKPTPPTNIIFSSSNYCPDAKPSTVTLTASGGTGDSYQWYTSCGSTVKATGTTYVLDPSPSVSDIFYVARTSGHCLPSSCYSEELVVRTESVQASSISATANNTCPGTATTLTVQGGSLGYGASWRWYIGTTQYATGVSYTPSPTSTTTYTVKAVGTCNTTAGVSKEIIVNAVPVKADAVTADDENLPAGGSTILRQVGGSDGSSTTWRWYKDGCGTGSPLGNGDLYNTGVLSSTTTFYLRAEDNCGNTDCVSKTVTVHPLSIDVQPQGSTVCVSGNTNVAVTASGYGLTYQWKKGGVDIPGANASSYSITGATLGDAGSYTCVVGDGINTATTVAATVNVMEAPEITSEPAATVTACFEETVQLEVVAVVTDAVTYQWKKNNVDMLGETASVLEFADATSVVNGFYTCYINDACGNLSTSGTNLTVANPPPMIELGDDQVVCLNAPVELSAGLGYNSFLWSTGETTQTITVLNKEGDYSVQGTDLNGCEGFSNTVNLSFVGPNQDAEICIVTVDSVTGKNMVVWEKQAGVGINSYNVWREGSTVNDSVLVKNVAFDALSAVVDDGSEPETKAHRYWITAIDSCGNESERSNIHKTMLMTTGLGSDRINLSWLEYEVEEQPYLFVGYMIFRSPMNSNFMIIDSIASGSPLYPDIEPPDGTNYYRIAGLLDSPCSPTGSKKAGTGPYTHSLSNLDDNKLREGEPAGIVQGGSGEQFAIYPNPFGNYTMVRFDNPDHSEYTLYIRDLSGKLVQTRKHITEQEFRIERGSLKAGYYHMELIGDKMFRGKMIIQ
ncbi:T9SS type A sorting domain-containing protein [Bacteroidota bacterium]